MRNTIYNAMIAFALFVFLIITTVGATDQFPNYLHNETCHSFIYNYTPGFYQTFVVPGNNGYPTSVLRYLVVAGGGYGGYSNQWDYIGNGYGGGGGAGGVLVDYNWTPVVGSEWRIDVGGNSTNSSLSNPIYGNITAVRGGAGGEGFPPDPLPPIPQIFGKWGGSGGGGGSGGSGTPWICQQGVGGANVTGQGFNGSPAFGGYALAIGGGGGGAGGPGNGGTCGESGGSGFVDSTFLFQTYEFAHGGNGESATLNPCFTTIGSGGRAWWHDYFGPACVPGNDGVVIIQYCFNGTQDVANLQPPIPVQFTVLTPNGSRITNAYVSIQGITTTAGSWDWLSTVFMIPLAEAPIENTLMGGGTDGYGTIEFFMVPTVKYNVTVVAPGYTFPTTYVYPHDTEYVIWANAPTIPDTGVKTFNVSKTVINAGLGTVTILYNDTGATTTGGFVNITNGKTQLYSLPVNSSSFNETRNITINTGGTSIIVSARILTTGDLYKKDYSVTYNGQPVVPGALNSELLMWGAFGIIMFTSLLTSIGAARHVSAVMCFEAWIFFSFGWFDPLTAKIGLITVIGLFSLATLITIIWNLKEGFQFET